MHIYSDAKSLSQKIMFVVVYGFEIATNKDDLPDKARNIQEMNEMLMVPCWDAFKNIPLVHRLPSWIPGGQIRAHHEISAQVFDQLAESSFEMTMNAMVGLVSLFNLPLSAMLTPDI